LPELLAPAGTFEKMEYAFAYGRCTEAGVWNGYGPITKVTCVAGGTQVRATCTGGYALGGWCECMGTGEELSMPYDYRTSWDAEPGFTGWECKCSSSSGNKFVYIHCVK